MNQITIYRGYILLKVYMARRLNQYRKNRMGGGVGSDWVYTDIWERLDDTGMVMPVGLLLISMILLILFVVLFTVK